MYVRAGSSPPMNSTTTDVPASASTSSIESVICDASMPGRAFEVSRTSTRRISSGAPTRAVYRSPACCTAATTAMPMFPAPRSDRPMGLTTEEVQDLVTDPPVLAAREVALHAQHLFLPVQPLV